MNSFLSFEDITRERKGYTLTQKAIVIMCVLSLVASIIVFVNIDKKNRQNAQVLNSFSEALDSGDYEKAISIYRGIYDEVVASDASERDSYEFQMEMLNSMTTIVSERVTALQERIRNERYVLSVSDLAFLNGMQELTGSLMSDWLYSLCEDFLLGSIEKPDVSFIFEQLVTITNISATASSLLMEVDTIEVARGLVQSAESSLLNGDYISAVTTYLDVSETYDGFVYDYSVDRVNEIKEEMYEPMLQEGEHMLERFQYYSAEELLSDLAAIFPEDERIGADLLEATSNTQPVSEYLGPVEVLSISNLIVDESQAFDTSISGSGSDLHLTCDEFLAVLENLYANDYVLVDAEGLVDLSSTDYLVEQNLVVPDGKKPVIIIIEALDYPAIQYETGVCESLVLNDQGQVCGQYRNSDGQAMISRDAEAIGILDEFVEVHPDFSFNGVKGVISVCGYESCFGYVVNQDEVDDRNSAFGAIGYPAIDYTEAQIQSNCETVSRIAEVLLDYGWKFASSTYGNINAEASDIETITEDITKWNEQIGVLLGGNIHMLVYPNGNFINGTDSRAEYLKSIGFRIFFGIGSQAYYTYGINYLYYDRTLLNGQTLRTYDLSRMLDVTTVYDSNRPIPLEG